MLKPLLLLLLLLLPSLGHGQTLLTGTVRDSEGAPLPAVIVRAYAQGAKVVTAYTQTDEKGKYRLTLGNDSKGEFRLKFTHLSYKPVEVILPHGTQRQDVKLSERAQAFREVTVKSNYVHQRGDTLTYRVSSLAGKADRNIEDVIRRIPGINIATNGEISYQGEAINRFYIEGRDLLGGNYGLATRNIKPGDVQSVSVLENHQPVKLLKDLEVSKQAALNLSLKKGALGRLVGNAKMGAGAGDGARWLAELYGMQIFPHRQTMYAVKGNNFAEDYAIETIDFLLQHSETPIASLFPDTPFGTSSLPRRRYADNRSAFASWHTLFDLGKEKDLVLKGQYTLGRHTFSQFQQSEYYGLQTPLVVMEAVDNDLITQGVDLSLKYEHNSDSAYLAEKTALRAHLRRNIYDLPTGSIRQRWREVDVSWDNLLAWKRRKGRHLSAWELKTGLSTTPTAQLTADRESDGTALVRQEVSALRAFATTSTHYAYQLGENGRWGQVGLHLNVYASYQRFASEQTNLLTAPRNDNWALGAELQGIPHYSVGGRGFHLEVRLPVRYLLHDFHNRYLHTEFLLNRPYFVPSVTLLKRWSSLFVTGTTAYHVGVGRFQDFLVAPLYQTYRQQIWPGSGALSRSRTWQSELQLMWRDTYRGRSVNWTATYNRTKAGQLQASTIGPQGGTTSQEVLHDNTQSSWMTTARATLYNRPIHTHFALSLRYNGSQRSMLRQQSLLTTRTHHVYTAFSTDCNWWRQLLQVRAQVAWERSFLHFAETRSALNRWSGSVYAAFTPGEHWEVSVQGEMARNEQQRRHYLTSFFFDARMRYKRKRWEAELQLHNLADTRRYEVRTYMLTDIYTYGYRLRPREALLSLKWSF